MHVIGGDGAAEQPSPRNVVSGREGLSESFVLRRAVAPWRSSPRTAGAAGGVCRSSRRSNAVVAAHSAVSAVARHSEA